VEASALYIYIYIYISAYDYENNQQDALYRLIYYSMSTVHVSGGFRPSSGALDCIYTIR